jgi:hypothetical protein
MDGTRLGDAAISTICALLARAQTYSARRTLKRRWLVRRQGLKKEKEAGLRRIPLQPAALIYYKNIYFAMSKNIFSFFCYNGRSG